MNLIFALIASATLGIADSHFQDQQQLQPLPPEEPAELVHIPEPSTIALAALGLIGMGFCRRRRIDGGSH
ncbi:PEP-CTERM sorting domain-containing protein [Lacipirellula sp.]|uniref:PEP-CTERM sorting domain-containing protein n=1 Tax=Lacipirellula sp. TaxID=2691419 RepID=UPI003D10CD18